MTGRPRPRTASRAARAPARPAWLGDLTITRHDDGTSTLTGPVADQAQLHGVLARLRDIGATLLSLNALEASPLPGQP